MSSLDDDRPELRSKCVLFADDSSVARMQIRKTLDRLSMSYVIATTGGEAWQSCKALADQATAEGKRASGSDPVHSGDIEMPEMDGFYLTKHIRADPRLAHLPVMLHSSLTGACNMEKGRTVGATDYITKFDAKCWAKTGALHSKPGTPMKKAA